MIFECQGYVNGEKSHVDSGPAHQGKIDLNLRRMTLPASHQSYRAGLIRLVGFG